ncbi:hypothetical protein OS493_037898, partial [Desmophyllum pertusum]
SRSPRFPNKTQTSVFLSMRSEFKDVPENVHTAEGWKQHHKTSAKMANLVPRVSRPNGTRKEREEEGDQETHGDGTLKVR